MKLYYVTRPEPVGYDEYDAFVCVARDENAARYMHPNFPEKVWNSGKRCWAYASGGEAGEEALYDSWTTAVELLVVEELGTTERDVGVVLASFNAR